MPEVNSYIPNQFDVIVVGGGHAGAEASYVCARAGLKTALVTMNLDTIGQMSCNPAIGGIAKGHIVREIDALGGIMGRVIDRTGIHFKMLNRSRGPAVWAPRAQAEKRQYQNVVKWILENTPNLVMRQDTCNSLIIENNEVMGIVTGRKHEIYAKNVLLTTGTFLRGLIHIGDYNVNSGRIAESSSEGISPQLKNIGFSVGRLKTGTPPRIQKNTIDFDGIDIQKPDEVPVPFSFATECIRQDQIDCHITYTNPTTHKIIEDNIHRSPLYSGQISGTGPRYCPSIEDKVVRFKERERHQIFIEPEGVETGEIYLNGISTSLPEDVQWRVVRSCRGLENAQIIRPGYAVEYDFVDPTELTPDLQTKRIKNLYFAGQINGTTGYEEAAAQGIMAGINIIRKFRGEDKFILSRGEAYTGVLIDDLVYKGVEDPYRMFTSRAEHRLLLRQDNADKRLMGYGYSLGLIDKEAFVKMTEKYEIIDTIKTRFYNTGIRPSGNFENLLKIKNMPDKSNLYGKTVASFLKRPEIKISDCLCMVDGAEVLKEDERIILEMEIKYDGYIEREKELINKRKNLMKEKIPEGFNYGIVEGLKNEAREKLVRFRPSNLESASRISGVDSPDLDLILLYIRKLKTPEEGV